MNLLKVMSLHSGILSSKVLFQFFSDFHNLFITGMNMNQIIDSLKVTSSDKMLQDILPKVLEGMNEGESLAQALMSTEKFPWIVYSTIQAGERSGRLKESVNMLAQYFKNSSEMKGKLGNALFYPIVVFIFLFVVMFFISYKVVPKLQGLLPQDALTEPSTVFVLTLTKILQTTGPIFLILIVIGSGLLIHYLQKDKKKLESFLYQLPLLGSLFKEGALAMYFLNLSVLLKSGSPLIKAINQMDETASTMVSRKFATCRDYMLGGLSFWESLQMEAFFPKEVVLTLRRGEEAGKIAEYCSNLSEYFFRRVQDSIERILNLIQPLFLIVGGLFLMVLALAFLIPIYGSLSKIAGG
jgi:type IV pilus assembly protein PilC